MTLGEYVLHNTGCTMLLESCPWKPNKMQLNFSNGGNKKIFISNDYLFPETFGSNNK